MLDPENTQVLSWMRQAHGASQVVVSVNFTAKPQIVNLQASGAGFRARKVRTLLKTPGAADPAALDRITLGPYGVYIGEVR